MQSNGNGTEVWEKGIQVDLPAGEYEIEVQLTGGSGRASVTSPAILQVQDEKAIRIRGRAVRLSVSLPVQKLVLP